MSPYNRSHRHFSHLLMFYPLHLLNAEQKGSKELLEKSVEHWHNLPDNILGFSYTGASLLYAAFGEGSKALEKIKRPVCPHPASQHNVYGKRSRYRKRPYQAHNVSTRCCCRLGKRKYAYSPPSPQWQDVRFQDLRAEGAFLVSAIRKGGKTTDIRIKSLAGEPSILQTDMENPVVKIGNAMLVPQGKGVRIGYTKRRNGDHHVPRRRSIPDRPVEGKGGTFRVAMILLSDKTQN